MTQTERRIFLIQELLREQPRYGGLEIPADGEGQRRMLRSLMNLRPPWPAAQEFLQVQDAYLQEETRRKGITALASLRPVQKGLYLWQGDITTLACGAIVNAANSQLLGCFVPCHGCIDNSIPVQITYRFITLRRASAYRRGAGEAASITGLVGTASAFWESGQEQKSAPGPYQDRERFWIGDPTYRPKQFLAGRALLPAYPGAAQPLENARETSPLLADTVRDLSPPSFLSGKLQLPFFTSAAIVKSS